MNIKRLGILFAGTVLLASPAYAMVVLDPHLSGTGDNVIFDSHTGSTVIGTLNGMHPGFVDFHDLSGNANFTGAQNGNDIKIQNTSDLSIQLFSDAALTKGLFTSEDVFSLKGTGDVKAFVTATDGTFQFDLGQLNIHSPVDSTFNAIDGESISKIVLLDVTPGGDITDFEHYRIEVAPSAVPIPGALFLFGGGLAGLIALGKRKRSIPSLA